MEDAFAAIIDLWPSHDALAEDVGLKRNAPAVWKHRNSIPPEYWAAVVIGAERRGIAGVTLERFARLASVRAKTEAA